MNRPGHRVAACLGKAALKTHALQTLRECRASPKRAKRLECVRFIGAFRRARDGQRFMVPTHRRKAEGLSMNRAQTDPPLTPPRRGTGQPESLPSWEGLGVGSWSQCIRKHERGLSMNLPGHPIVAWLGKAAL